MDIVLKKFGEYSGSDLNDANKLPQSERIEVFKRFNFHSNSILRTTSQNLVVSNLLVICKQVLSLVSVTLGTSPTSERLLNRVDFEPYEGSP